MKRNEANRMTAPNSTSKTISSVSSKELAQKRLFFINGALLTFIGAIAAVSDLVAYRTGVGPLGAQLFNAPYAVSFFELHGPTALFGLLLLTMARREPKPGWHIATATFHLFLAVGIAIFWQGAVAWSVTTAETATVVLDVVFATAHLLLYSQVRSLVK